MNNKTTKTMEKFKGYVYSKLDRIGTKSEGPEYYLQDLSDSERPVDKHIKKKANLWMEDPILNQFIASKSIVSGNLEYDSINYESIKKENAYQVPMEQTVFFEFHFKNSAWGYQNTGWFIDKSGEIREYKLTPADKWNEPDKFGYISMEKLNENYLLAQNTVMTIDKSQLDYNVSLIEEAAKGELSPIVHSAYDAGSSCYFCYYWDTAKDTYKQILLSMWGDFSQSNLSSRAIEMDKWLKQI
jgi:hypothetical protein